MQREVATQAKDRPHTYERGLSFAEGVEVETDGCRVCGGGPNHALHGAQAREVATQTSDDTLPRETGS